MRYLSKLTLKTMDAQPKPHSINEATDLATIYGVIRGKKVGQSNFGDFVNFSGEFEGVNIQTGEVFRSGNMILPKMMESMLAGSFDEDAKDISIEFGVKIGVIPSEKGNTGYEYTISPLIETAPSDALLALRNMAQAKVPEIGAIVESTEEAPAKGKAKAKAEA